MITKIISFPQARTRTLFAALLALLLSGPLNAQTEGEKPAREPKEGEVREGTPRRARETGERKTEREPGERRVDRDEGRAAEGERPRDGARPRRPVHAILLKVQSPSVLLVGVGDALKEMQVPIEPETEILLQGERVKLTELKPDMPLVIEQEAGLTRRVQARYPRNRGAGDGQVRRAGQPDGGRPKEGERPAKKDGDRQPAEGERDRAR